MLRFYPIVHLWMAFALVQNSMDIFPGCRDKVATFCFCGAICAPRPGWLGDLCCPAGFSIICGCPAITRAVNGSGVVGFPKRRRKKRFWSMFVKIAWDIGKAVVVETVKAVVPIIADELIKKDCNELAADCSCQNGGHYGNCMPSKGKGKDDCCSADYKFECCAGWNQQTGTGGGQAAITTTTLAPQIIDTFNKMLCFQAEDKIFCDSVKFVNESCDSSIHYWRIWNGASGSWTLDSCCLDRVKAGCEMFRHATAGYLKGAPNRPNCFYSLNSECQQCNWEVCLPSDGAIGCRCCDIAATHNCSWFGKLPTTTSTSTTSTTTMPGGNTNSAAGEVGKGSKNDQDQAFPLKETIPKESVAMLSKKECTDMSTLLDKDLFLFCSQI
uniref:SMB domain-containing protein n=1 Tax=Globodera pallida TaxID=36090 RepID=A0A183BKU2_GLOPA